MSKKSRRDFLTGAVAASAVAGCRARPPLWCHTEAGGDRWVDDLANGQKFDANTAEATEGPYYVPGAPERSDLIDPRDKGDVLNVDGRLRIKDETANPAGYSIEVWHANPKGKYDDKPDRLRYRARINLDREGQYRFRTLMPGQYRTADEEFGNYLRPAHIHYKVWKGARLVLTTQLYFENDPYLNCDPFVIRSLIMPVDEIDGELYVTFDLTIAK